MNNLKVNANSSILEFKRKHNLLVDASSVKISATNITTLSDEELNELKCGDMVQKKTGNQLHNYIVTYKEENHGICLSYYDCGYTETVSYDFVEGHWVYNSTDVSLCNSLEEITDSHGNKRFIEGEINFKDSGIPESLTKTYGKWSLCGTHLMIVFCYSVPAETTISYIGNLCEIELPQWVKDKIIPSGETYVAVNSNTPMYNPSDNSIQTFVSILRKSSGGTIFISHGDVITTKLRNVRISFDLLIDNESAE